MHWSLNFFSSVHMPTDSQMSLAQGSRTTLGQGGLGLHSWVNFRTSVVVDPYSAKGRDPDPDGNVKEPL